MSKHMLVPVDLSNTNGAEKAIAAAKKIARRDGARITIVSIVPAWPENPETMLRDYQPELDTYVDAVRDHLDIESEVKIGGSISGGIIGMAKEKQIDLIVMVSHDPCITDYLTGSNAARVVLHAPCSVMVVR